MSPRQTTEERFWAKVNKNGPVPTHRPDLGPCWVWMGSLSDKGYGRFDVYPGKKVRAHRWAFEEAKGPIPQGLVPDHLCRTPACVRPGHMEAVTNFENTIRGTGVTATNSAKTHCPRGHFYDLLNTGFWKRKEGGQSRYCRQCEADWARLRRGRGNEARREEISNV